MGRTMHEQNFSQFWERKLPRLKSSLPGWRDSTHRDVDERLERQRLVAWVQALYGDAPGPPVVSVCDMVELVTAVATQVRDTGRKLDRVKAQIPVATHRAWCEGLTALSDAGGWPRLAGIEITADTLADPPPNWEPGLPAIEDRGDRVTILPTNRWPPLADKVLVSTLDSSAEAIYRQLRIDGWLIHPAIEAAQILTPAAEPVPSDWRPPC